MIDRQTHFDLGYAIYTIKSLVQAMENTNEGVEAEITRHAALETAKEFLAKQELATKFK